MSAFGRTFAWLGLFVQRHRQRQCLASSPGAAPRRATSRSSGHSSKPRAEQQQQRSDGSSSSDERQSHGPPTGRGACFMYEHERTHGARRRTGASHPPPDGRECALSRRALEGQRHARAEQQQRQQRRASVPRPAKGRGYSCKDMRVNMTQLISRRARRARRRRDKERRERALSQGALDEQRQQRAGQQQQQQRRRLQSRDPSRDAVFHVSS